MKSNRLLKDIAPGLIGGMIATFIMDKVTTAMYNRESEETKRKESELMKQPAYDILARRAARLADIELTDRQASKGGSFFHWAYGIMWGGLYGALHGRVPAVAKARGLVYGLGVFLLGDEALNTALRISPPPHKFPPAVHLRGLIGHLVYAITADGAYRLLRQAV